MPPRLHLPRPSPPSRDPGTEQGSRAMTDHESFVLLAAKQLSEPLSSAEEDELAAHLAECPRCRSIAAGMRRDNDRLQAELGAAPVSPRVRARVLDETTGRRRIDGRLVLGLAAVLLLGADRRSLHRRWTSRNDPGAVGAGRIADSSRRRVAGAFVCLEPSLRREPTVSPSPPDSGAFVAGSYVYGHDLHAATPSQRSSRRVNRLVSGRESALLMGPGTRTRGQSRAS